MLSCFYYVTAKSEKTFATRLDSSELKGSVMKWRNEAGIWKYKQWRWSRDFKTVQIRSEAAERRRAEHAASLWSPANSDKLGPETLLLVIGDFPPSSWPDKDVHLLRPGVEKESPGTPKHFMFSTSLDLPHVSKLGRWLGKSIGLLHSSGPIRSDQPWRQRLRLPIGARGDCAVASRFAPKSLSGLLEAKAS